MECRHGDYQCHNVSLTDIWNVGMVTTAIAFYCQIHGKGTVNCHCHDVAIIDMWNMVVAVRVFKGSFSTMLLLAELTLLPKLVHFHY